MLPEFQPPSLAVAVWVVLSLFVQVTLPPIPTVMGLGANAVAVKIEAPLTMETGVPPALGDGDEGVVVDEDELPQAVRNSINPVTENKRTIMWTSQLIAVLQSSCRTVRPPETFVCLTIGRSSLVGSVTRMRKAFACSKPVSRHRLRRARMRTGLACKYSGLTRLRAAPGAAVLMRQSCNAAVALE